MTLMEVSIVAYLQSKDFYRVKGHVDLVSESL